MVFAELDGDGLLDCATANFDSGSLTILHGTAPAVGSSFRRGDVDLDGRVVLTDAVAVLERLFRGAGPLPCRDAADTNDDGSLNLTDAVYLLQYLFRSGAPPPPPHPGCGLDPSSDQLDCVQTRCAGAGAP